MLQVSDNFLEIRDLNKYKEDKIKLVADDRNGCIIVLLYFI